MESEQQDDNQLSCTSRGVWSLNSAVLAELESALQYMTVRPWLSILTSATIPTSPSHNGAAIDQAP